MPSARAVIAKRSSNTLLHGNDLPEGQRTIKIHIIGVREAPEKFWPTPFILIIEEVLDGRKEFLLNLTNSQEVAELLGDNYSYWVGATVTLIKADQYNPKTNEQVYGLVVRDATLPDRKKK